MGENGRKRDIKNTVQHTSVVIGVNQNCLLGHVHLASRQKCRIKGLKRGKMGERGKMNVQIAQFKYRSLSSRACLP